MKKILIVEDDTLFREAIASILKRKGYELFEAENGKIAQKYLSENTYDIVITDVQMPEMTGVELLKWSVNHSKTPFIVMTGFSALLETQSAFDLGAKEFVTKPFKNKDLYDAIERTLSGTTTQNAENQNIEFCKVAIEEFEARPKVLFDVFIQLTDQKYVKIAHQGDGLDIDRIRHYKEKGLRFLYVKEADFSQFIAMNLKIADAMKNNPDISNEKKINFLKFTGEVILEKAFIGDVNQKSFDEANAFVKVAMDAITNTKDYMDLLLLLNSHSDHIYAHSIGVSMYCVMIAKKMKYESSQTLFKLSMAALFHDIGKKEIDQELLDKPRHLLSSKERKMIESHVVRGQEILMAVKGIPEDVVQMVYEHHEDSGAQGYPNSRELREQHPLSRILQTANLFVQHALKSPNSEGMAGKKAILHLEKTYGERLDPVSMNALKAVFSDDAPES